MAPDPATRPLDADSRPQDPAAARSPWWLPVSAAAAAAGAVGAVWLLGRWGEGDVGLLVRDPSTTFESSLLVGVAAMLNATLWGVAAALGGFVASLHRGCRPGLLLFAGLSLALMVEDTVQVKSLGERLGIPEELFLAAYGVAGLAVAWLLRPSRTGAAGWTLLAAGALLAASIAVDLLRGATNPGAILLEFAPMLVGTALWACVPVLLHHHLVARRTAGRARPTDPEGSPAGPR